MTSGSTICPHPKQGDQSYDRDLGLTEDYEHYVRRHARDHNLGEFDELIDGERNLGCWCLFYMARHVIGNLSLGTQYSSTRMLAHWEPCWEDAEYLNNWIFSPRDTEQDTDWNERTFMLKPYAERDHENAVYKRFKKHTKVRDTQKTSWGKANITCRQVRAYFVEDRPNYRCLVISGTSTLSRDHYLEPLKEMWTSHANLQRLYGTMTYTKRYEALMRRRSKGKPVDDDELEAEKRPICLLAPGSRGKDTLRMRWIVRQKDSSGLSAISLKVAGMETTTTGNRWDLVTVDDPVVPENVGSEPLRKKVKGKIADLRKQGDADSEFVYLNTPYHIDDASSQIDNEQGHQYHIMYRPAMWFELDETSTPVPRFYWQYNATEPGIPVKGKPPRNAVWPESRIDDERNQPDFHSQVLLRPRDAATAIFDEKDFKIVDPENAPLEILAGLGGPITTDQRSQLEAESVERRAFILIDPAGNESETGSTNAETAIIGAGITRFGEMVVTHIEMGRMSATQEENAIFAACERVNPDRVRYEIVSAGKKMVQKNFARFQVEKSRELGRPILIPFDFVDASTTKGKLIRVPKLQPYAKSGRIWILKNAAPMHVIKRFVAQFTDWPASTKKDGADALSMILEYTNINPYEDRPDEKRAEDEKFRIDEDGTMHIPAAFILEKINEATTKTVPWGKRGMSRG